jgi:hypothetical protein
MIPKHAWLAVAATFVLGCTLTVLGAALQRTGQGDPAAKESGGKSEPGDLEKEGLLGTVRKLKEQVDDFQREQQQHRVVRGGDGENGYLLVGDTLICWGRAILPPLPMPNRHTRSFSFNFPKEFVATPTVTTGFDLTTPGHVYGVYHSTVKPTMFFGQAYDNKSSDAVGGELVSHHRVVMSYLAIGKAKPKHN